MCFESPLRDIKISRFYKKKKKKYGLKSHVLFKIEKKEYL